MPSTSATICAIAVSEPCPMSTVPQCSAQLPSPYTWTIATEVVGEMQAFRPSAIPRPRRMVPLPRSNGRVPLHPLRQPVEHRLDGGVLHHGAGRLRAAVAQDVPAPELDRVDPERARHDVGVALVGPHELRDAKAAQRAGRRQVGVERIGIDVTCSRCRRARRREARFLRDARADVGIGAAVPPHLALARGDAAVLHAALDAEGAGVLGERVELLLHRQRNLHRPARSARSAATSASSLM